MKIQFFILLNLITAISYAQPGTLDSTFGVGGVAPMGGWLSGKIAVLPDGKLLAFSRNILPDMDKNLQLRRFNEDGSPDESFGTGGWLTIDIPGMEINQEIMVFPRDIVALSNGKALICGGLTILDSLQNLVSSDAFLVRVNYDGQLDSSFGENGKLTIKVDSISSRIDEMALLPDGKIVLFVGLSTPGTFGDYAFIRLLEDGSFDATFGDGGISKHNEGMIEIGNAVFCVHPNGEITLAGDYQKYTSLYHFDNTGKIDSTFGVNGNVLPDISWSWEMVFRAIVDHDGNILTCGYGYLGGNTVISVCRFLPNGQLDSSFNGNGIILDPIAAFDSESYTMAIQPDGKILVGGYGIFSDLKYYGLLIRYNPDGTPDLSFGNNGYVQTDFQSLSGSIGYLTLTSNGKIQVTGSDGTGLVLARFNSGITVLVNNPKDTIPGQFLQLFPNPVAGDQIIKFGYYLTEGTLFRSEIWDIQGQLIYSESIDGGAGWNEVKIHANLLPQTGIYVLWVQSSLGVESIKFVKN